MAVVPVTCKMPYKDHVLPPQQSVRRHERGLMCVCCAFAHGCISCDARRRWQVLYPAADNLIRTKTRGEVSTSKGNILNQGSHHFQNMIETLAQCRVWNIKGEIFFAASHGSKSSPIGKQQRLLDSYFRKFQGDVTRPFLDSSDETIESLVKTAQIRTKEELNSLNSYLGKLDKNANFKNYKSSSFDGRTTEGNPMDKPFSVYEDSGKEGQEKPKTFIKFKKKDVNSGSGRSQP